MKRIIIFLLPLYLISCNNQASPSFQNDETGYYLEDDYYAFSRIKFDYVESITKVTNNIETEFALYHTNVPGITHYKKLNRHIYLYLLFKNMVPSKLWIRDNFSREFEEKTIDSFNKYYTDVTVLTYLSYSDSKLTPNGKTDDEYDLLLQELKNKKYKLDNILAQYDYFYFLPEANYNLLKYETDISETYTPNTYYCQSLPVYVASILPFKNNICELSALYEFYSEIFGHDFSDELNSLYETLGEKFTENDFLTYINIR